MRVFLFSFCFLLGLSTYGQSLQFISDLDQDLTIRKISVAPLADNVSGIYSKPLTEQIIALVSQDKRWDIVPFPSDIKANPEDFESQPKLVIDALKKSNSDSFIAGRLSKGPNGVSLKLTWYAGKDGFPLAEESARDYSGFDIKDLRVQTEALLTKLMNRLPYHGLILSRRGQEVTFNLGSQQGLREGADLSAIQIIKVERHPKFHFLINTETTVLGKIKVQKVEDSISFGTIVAEREGNNIQPKTKLLIDRFKTFSETPLTAEGKAIGDLNGRPESNMVFGNKATEWVPERPPTFGKIGILFGLGSYNISNSLTTGSVSGAQQVSPSIQATGEMWINPEWFLGASLRQFVASVDNQLANSTPGKLNINSLQTTLLAGYNFLVANDFFGPKIQLSIGWSKMNIVVDQSTPSAFNSMSFDGFLLGIGGSVPIQMENHKPFSLGGKLMYPLSANVSESPTTSGASSSAQMTSFAAFVDYRFSERMNIHSELAFDSFAASFSGAGSRPTPASSASHNMTSLAAGVEYMF